MLFKQHDKSSSVNSTHYAMLYPQNGDYIVAIDSVTLLHSMCTSFTCKSKKDPECSVVCVSVSQDSDYYNHLTASFPGQPG